MRRVLPVAKLLCQPYSRKVRLERLIQKHFVLKQGQTNDLADHRCSQSSSTTIWMHKHARIARCLIPGPIASHRGDAFVLEMRDEKLSGLLQTRIIPGLETARILKHGSSLRIMVCKQSNMVREDGSKICWRKAAVIRGTDAAFKKRSEHFFQKRFADKHLIFEHTLEFLQVLEPTFWCRDDQTIRMFEKPHATVTGKFCMNHHGSTGMMKIRC